MASNRRSPILRDPAPLSLHERRDRPLFHSARNRLHPPEGVEESESANPSPLECLHIYLPDALIAQSALADDDIDPAKAELSYVGGLRDPKLYQLAMGFNDVLKRPSEPSLSDVRQALAFAEYRLRRSRASTDARRYFARDAHMIARIIDQARADERSRHHKAGLLFFVPAHPEYLI